MKYGIIKVKRAFLYEENGVDVVDEVFFGWSVMWEDEGEWIEVWTHYGYRGWMERNLIEEKSREWMEGREKAGNTYVVTRGFADVMRGARVQARMLETLGTGVFCGENGGDGEWVLQGETGEWDQWVCAGGGIKKKTGFGSVFVGKIGREVFLWSRGFRRGGRKRSFGGRLWSVRRGILDASTGGAGRRRMGLTVRVWCLWCI